MIEIASASDAELDRREKLPRYRQAGIPEIWLVDPFAREARVERRSPQGYETTVLASGRLGSEIIPGFWIEVGWLWQDPLPATLPCLREILG